MAQKINRKQARDGFGFPDVSGNDSGSQSWPSGNTTNALLFTAPEDGYFGGHMNSVQSGQDVYVRYGASNGQIIFRHVAGGASCAMFIPIAKGDSLYITKYSSATGGYRFFPAK